MMAAAGVRPRFRPRTRGPEADLVDDAIRAGLLRGNLEPVVLREPELATGFPDVVAAYPRRKVLRLERAALGRDHLRLLHFLWANGGATTLAAAQTLLRFSAATTRRLAAELHEQRAIVLKGERVVMARSASDSAFAASRIVAVEAKMSKWEDAIAQACGNAWFASHSYVLLPSRSLGDRASTHARALGIGVLVLEDERIVTIEAARARPIPASLGSWIVNEWMIHELRRGSGA